MWRPWRLVWGAFAKGRGAAWAEAGERPLKAVGPPAPGGRRLQTAPHSEEEWYAVHQFLQLPSGGYPSGRG